MKKIIYTLNVGDYAPNILDITRPSLEAYARKIRAEIFEIKERKYPEFGVTYEKIQIYDLAREHGAEWIYYIDGDALIHNDFYDVTLMLNKDTVCHNGSDFAPMRWVYDEYFMRDGRNLGSGNWFTVASNWCLDLWHPLEDLSPEEAESRINPILLEKNGCTTSKHLIDDYVLSRNIARYGLKVKTVKEIRKDIGGYVDSRFLFHRYNIPIEQKVVELKRVWDGWNGKKDGKIPINQKEANEMVNRILRSQK